MYPNWINNWPGSDRIADRIYEKSANLLGLDRGLDFYFPISGSGSWIGFFWIFFWIWILDRIFLDFFLDRIFLDFFLDLDLGLDFLDFFLDLDFFGFFPGSGFNLIFWHGIFYLNLYYSALQLMRFLKAFWHGILFFDPFILSFNSQWNFFAYNILASILF